MVQNSIKIDGDRSRGNRQTDRQTDASDRIAYFVLCYAIAVVGYTLRYTL